MAYTKIIKVKSNLNLCLDYTSNPKKTERRSAEDLNRLLSYTQSNDKTEHQLYVSGFNCIPQNAYEIMMETKQRWRKPVKDGNILAYHIIQSFSPGEATPKCIKSAASLCSAFSQIDLNVLYQPTLTEGICIII